MSKGVVAFRVIEHTIIFSLAAGALLVLLGLVWLVIPVVLIIVVWESFTYYREVNKEDLLDMTSDVEGLQGVALTDIVGEGKVDVGGRIWSAQSVNRIEKGSNVHVVKKVRSVLEVEPA